MRLRTIVHYHNAILFSQSVRTKLRCKKMVDVDQKTIRINVVAISNFMDVTCGHDETIDVHCAYQGESFILKADWKVSSLTPLITLSPNHLTYEVLRTFVCFVHKAEHSSPCVQFVNLIRKRFEFPFIDRSRHIMKFLI